MSQYGDHGEEEPSVPSSLTDEFKPDIVERCLKGDGSIKAR
jgi:hypothetical protein